MVVDVLSQMINRVVDKSLVKGLRVGAEEIIVLHLQFADDTVLFLLDDCESFSDYVIFASNF